LIIYPVGRFLLEFLRLDASQVAGLNANQTMMAVVALAAAAILYLRHRNPAATAETAAEETAIVASPVTETTAPTPTTENEQ
jgi:phosphatidylglycerol:prolipoprotein diacylglycerol transferase